MPDPCLPSISRATGPRVVLLSPPIRVGSRTSPLRLPWSMGKAMTRGALCSGFRCARGLDVLVPFWARWFRLGLLSMVPRWPSVFRVHGASASVGSCPVGNGGPLSCHVRLHRCLASLVSGPRLFQTSQSPRGPWPGPNPTNDLTRLMGGEPRQQGCLSNLPVAVLSESAAKSIPRHPCKS